MRLIIVPLVAIFIAKVCDVNAIAKLPNVRYLGMGYDIIRGNPEDRHSDPGFRFSVLKFTWENSRTTSDAKYMVPDHIQALHTEACGYNTFTSTITGSKSYQKELSRDAKIDVSFQTAPAMAFSASAGYQDVSEQSRNSQYKRIYTNTRGKCILYEVSVNYQHALITVTDDFKRAVNALPLLENHMDAYTSFIYNYGTHFTSRVVLGAKFVIRTEFTEKSWQSMSEEGVKVELAADATVASASGSGGSATKDQNAFQSSRSSYTAYYRGVHPPSDGKWETWANLTGDSPAPISYVLVPLKYLVREIFFPGMTASDLVRRQNLLGKAYSEYCDKVPGCEIPQPDPATMLTNTATANFRDSPSLLLCRPKYNLLSCGIKNTRRNAGSSSCDLKRCAIPHTNNTCECSDKNGAQCVSWCARVDLNFTRVTSGTFETFTEVFCPTGYKVITTYQHRCASLCAVD